MPLADEERCATCGSGDPVQRMWRGEECGDPYHVSAWDEPHITPGATHEREDVANDLEEIERLRQQHGRPGMTAGEFVKFLPEHLRSLYWRSKIGELSRELGIDPDGDEPAAHRDEAPTR